MMIRPLLTGLMAAGIVLPAVAQDKKPAAKPAPAAAATKAADKAEAPAPAPAAPVDPAVVKSDTSYGFGFRAGAQFAQQYGRFGLGSEQIDGQAFAKGFVAALKGDKPEVSEEKLQAAMQALGDQLQKVEKEIAEKNLADGKKFLEENGKRKEVTTTKSGLQYEVLTKGGDKKYEAPKDGKADNKQFMVNYKGTLINGTEFDASPAGSPVPMTLQVIPGFKEAITTMPIGAKWKLFIPSALAYGEQRCSKEIAPNSTLVFELELVDIKDAPAPEAGGGFPMPIPQGGPQGE